MVFKGRMVEQLDCIGFMFEHMQKQVVVGSRMFEKLDLYLYFGYWLPKLKSGAVQPLSYNIKAVPNWVMAALWVMAAGKTDLIKG